MTSNEGNQSTGSGGGSAVTEQTTETMPTAVTLSQLETSDQPGFLPTQEGRTGMTDNSTIFTTITEVVTAPIKSVRQMAVKRYGEKAVAETIEQAKQSLQTTIRETAIVATYSLKGVIALLATLFAALNIMVYRSLWLSYTTLESETIADIASRYNMLESRFRRVNHLDINATTLPQGTKVSVRNRVFIERDYLDQLQYVLKDFLNHRKWVMKV